MCTIQKPKKRFDYDAYIQGRLIGKYVVIYYDEITDIPEDEVPENNTILAPQPIAIAETGYDIPKISGRFISTITSIQYYPNLKQVFLCVANRSGLAMPTNGCAAGNNLGFHSCRAGPC